MIYACGNKEDWESLQSDVDDFNMKMYYKGSAIAVDYDETECYIAVQDEFHSDWERAAAHAFFEEAITKYDLEDIGE